MWEPDFKVIVRNFISKDRYGSCKTNEWKRMKLVAEFKNNPRKPNFEALVLTLHCYYGDNVKYGLLSKKLVPK